MVSINRDLFHLKTKQILGKKNKINKKDKIILVLVSMREKDINL